MQMNAFDLERLRPIGFPTLPNIAEEIRHRRRAQNFGRAQRQTADRAHLLLELARGAGFDRPMAGIVRPRREFVHHAVSPVFFRNISTASKPDQIDLLRNGAREFGGVAFHFRDSPARARS